MLTERLSVSVDSSSLSAWDVALCKELIVLDWSLTQDQRPQMSSCSNGHKHSQADLRVDLNWINRSIQLYLFVLILEKGNEMKFANVLLWEPLGRNESLRAPCRKRFVLAALHFHCQENMFALYCAVLAQRLSFLIAWYLRFFIIPTSLSLSLSLYPPTISCYTVDGAWAADILLVDPRLSLCLFRLMKNDSSSLIEFYSFLTCTVLWGRHQSFD